MSLLDAIQPPIPTYLLPEIQRAVLAEVRERYRNEIEPETWKEQFDSEARGEYSQEFLEQSIHIVEDVISEFSQLGKIAPLMPKQLQYVREGLWEKAQSYWYEYAPELNAALNSRKRGVRRCVLRRHVIHHCFGRVKGEIVPAALQEY